MRRDERLRLNSRSGSTAAAKVVDAHEPSCACGKRAWCDVKVACVSVSIFDQQQQQSLFYLPRRIGAAANEEYARSWITPTEVSGCIPMLIGNRLAHVFPICALCFKAGLEFEQIGRNF